MANQRRSTSRSTGRTRPVTSRSSRPGGSKRGKKRAAWDAQIDIDWRPKGQRRGGKRPGAGRPTNRSKGLPSGVPHLRRERVTRHLPVHATLRLKKDIRACLRRRDVYAIIRGCIRRGAHRFGDFRVCEYSVQVNHLHFIIEASGNEALARGMKTLGGRLTKGINRRLGRRGRGTVWSDRYHATVARTPTQVRRLLVYVLCNGRKHVQSLYARGEIVGRRWIDPCSSARWFTGWHEDAGVTMMRSSKGAPATSPPEKEEIPTAEPESELLARLWRRKGLLWPWESPARA